jgi:hypothetical protein
MVCLSEVFDVLWTSKTPVQPENSPRPQPDQPSLNLSILQGDQKVSEHLLSVL